METTNMIICPICGHHTRDTAKFCTACGHPLPPVAPGSQTNPATAEAPAPPHEIMPEATSVQPSPRPISPVTPKPPSQLTQFLIIIGLIVALAIVAQLAGQGRNWSLLVSEFGYLQIFVWVFILASALAAIAKVVTLLNYLSRVKQDMLTKLTAYGLDLSQLEVEQPDGVGTKIRIQPSGQPGSMTELTSVLFWLGEDPSSAIPADLALGTKGISVTTSIGDDDNKNPGCVATIILLPLALIMTRGLMGRRLFHAGFSEVAAILPAEGTTIVIQQTNGADQKLTFLDETRKNAWLSAWQGNHSLFFDSDGLKRKSIGTYNYPLTLVLDPINARKGKIQDADGAEICRVAPKGSEVRFSFGQTQITAAVGRNLESKIVNERGELLGTVIRTKRLRPNVATLLDSQGNPIASLEVDNMNRSIALVNGQEALCITGAFPNYTMTPLQTELLPKQHELLIIIGGYLRLTL